MEALRDHICQHGPNSVEKPRPSRPIAFNDEMIRALLAGRKRQTRRLVDSSRRSAAICPFGAPCDRLWVRERWAPGNRPDSYHYSADNHGDAVRFRPTFHMPRAACRIELQICSVKTQPLQSISAADARDEGFDATTSDLSPRKWFAELWDRIFRAPGTRWEDNPQVWVLRFEILPPPVKVRPARPRRRAPA
ncbi:hypothetical protein BH09PLA1_BH09PLA1_09760 [soil metagenome]